jgi:hypothetical protein
LNPAYEFHFRTLIPFAVQIWLILAIFPFKTHAIPRKRDEMKEGDSQELSNRFAHSACGAVFRPLDRDGKNERNHSKPRKDCADWGKYIDPAGNIVRHLRKREEADEPLVCGP